MSKGASSTDVPAWVETEVRYWLDVFNLEQWDVEVGLERVVNDNAETLAWCERLARYNFARLHFRDDIENTQKWRKVILHECLHIVMGRVDEYVQDALIPQAAESSQHFAGMCYTQHVESFVQMLTTSFWRYYCEQMKREQGKKR